MKVIVKFKPLHGARDSKILNRCVPTWKTEIFFAIRNETNNRYIVFTKKGEHIIYSNGRGSVSEAWKEEYISEIPPVQVAQWRIEHEKPI